MIEISVKHIDNFKIEVQCKDNNILMTFMEFLTTKRVNKPMKLRTKTGRTFFTKEKITYSKLYRKNGTKLTLGSGLSDYLALHISSLFKKHTDLELKFIPKTSKNILLSEKWEKILLANPKGKEVGEMQVLDFKKLVAHNNGIAELYTGYGKTEMLLALAESSDKHTIILAPDNDILKEIMNRAAKYGMQIGNADWTKQINVINVIGFMKSKVKTPEAEQWLSEVKLVLGDECHHYTAKSYLDFFNLIPKIEQSYGFSASTDVEKGTKVQAGSVDIKDIGPRTGVIISMCGPVRVTRTTKVPVSLVKAFTNVADVEEVKNSKDWSNALDQSLINYKMSKVIQEVFFRDRSKVFFIPIHKKESGEVLYSNLIELGFKGIFWTSDSYLVNGETQKVKSPLLDIKYRMLKDPCTFVMGTRLEGVDIPKLDAVIPLVGANYRMIVQPVGRSARNEDLTIYLIYDRNNPITLSQARNRINTIEREYNIVSSKKIDIDV